MTRSIHVMAVAAWIGVYTLTASMQFLQAAEGSAAAGETGGAEETTATAARQGVSQNDAEVTARTVPREVRFSGVLQDAAGNALTGVQGVTFALYAEQAGGAPLWLETQNVTADEQGRYAVLLGAMREDGLP
ncbi:MAG: hypothetical protein HY316_03200, partial [Acidobacteria bacterium]|nr:hypothetical protein [Acidobacteriota bacterium]